MYHVDRILIWFFVPEIKYTKGEQVILNNFTNLVRVDYLDSTIDSTQICRKCKLIVLAYCIEQFNIWLVVK